MVSEWRRRLAAPDVVGGILTVAVCAFLGWETRSLPASSAIFPNMVLFLALVLGIAMAVQGFIKSGGKEDRPARFFKNRRRFFIAIGLTVLYILGINTLGFYSSTAILVPVIALVFGYRRPLVIVLSTIVFVIATYLLFGVAMDYRFPPEFFQSQQGGSHA